MNTNQYIPEEDIHETLPDGRVILVARAGSPMPMVEARRRGFIKDGPPVGPSETKTTSATLEGDEVVVETGEKVPPEGTDDATNEDDESSTPELARVGAERSGVTAPEGSARALDQEEAAAVVEEATEAESDKPSRKRKG